MQNEQEANSTGRACELRSLPPVALPPVAAGLKDLPPAGSTVDPQVTWGQGTAPHPVTNLPRTSNSPQTELLTAYC